jgi:heme exporter protein C
MRFERDTEVRRLRIAIVLVIIGGLLTTAAFFMAFFFAEVQSFGTETFPEALETAFPYTGQTETGYSYGRPWFSQKIFYFHVPVAEASFLILMIAAFFSARFLFTKKASDDTKARVAMETALVFVVLTMITGVLWTRASWGVWWEWEPRLTTYFIMMLMMIAYFVLRSSIEEEERRATYAAVFGILAAINAPISFMITRIIPSNHPVVFQSGMAGSNLLPFIIGQIGMLMIGYGIYVVRMSEERLHERIEIGKEALEG